MRRKLWLKAVLLLSGGTLLALGLPGGCLDAVVQRILVAVTFD